MASLADATVRTRLRSIDAFYHFAENYEPLVDLDVAISSLNTPILLELLQGFFNNERNRALQHDIDTRRRWKTVKSFVFESLSNIIDAQEDKNSLSALKSDVLRWEMLFKNLSPNSSKRKIQANRALPSQVVSELHEIFAPTSSINPFRTEKNRWRNFCLFLILLNQGLRRSEALLLPSNFANSEMDHNTGKVRFWMNIENKYEKTDPRVTEPPSIKNVQSIRQIPMSDQLASLIQTFVTNFRGKSPYPFLFLNSSMNPLGSRSVNTIFKAASEVLSASARKTLTDNLRKPSIAPHDLRHTCAVIRLGLFRKANIEEEDALHKLRAFMGWSYNSTMPRHYARTYWESTIHSAWNDDFNAHIDVLRSLETMQNNE